MGRNATSRLGEDAFNIHIRPKRLSVGVVIGVMGHRMRAGVCVECVDDNGRTRCNAPSPPSLTPYWRFIGLVSLVVGRLAIGDRCHTPPINNNATIMLAIGDLQLYDDGTGASPPLPPGFRTHKLVMVGHRERNPSLDAPLP